MMDFSSPTQATPDTPVTSSEATLLYLVRHGETDHNRQSIMQGRGVDSVLNANGEAQAHALARRLADVPFDVVYSSTLRRAKQTADIVAEMHQPIDVHHLSDLEEISWGVLEGEHPSDERDEQLGRVKGKWRQGVFDVAVEDGESALDVQARAMRAVNHILKREAGKTVLVVTHGRYLRVLLASILSQYGLERMDEVEHGNTSVNRVIHDEGVFHADLLNCTVHLED